MQLCVVQGPDFETHAPGAGASENTAWRCTNFHKVTTLYCKIMLDLQPVKSAQACLWASFLPFYLFLWDPWEGIWISLRKVSLLNLAHPSDTSRSPWILILSSFKVDIPPRLEPSGAMSGVLAISSSANGKGLYWPGWMTGPAPTAKISCPIVHLFWTHFWVHLTWKCWYLLIGSLSRVRL